MCPPAGPAGCVFTVDFMTPVVDDPESSGARNRAPPECHLQRLRDGRNDSQVALSRSAAVAAAEPVPGTMARIFRGGRDKAARPAARSRRPHDHRPGAQIRPRPSGTLEGGARSLTSTFGLPSDTARCSTSRSVSGGLASAEAAAPAPRRARAGRGRDDDPEPRRRTRHSPARCAQRPTSRGFGLLGHLHHLLLGAKLSAHVSAQRRAAAAFARRLGGAGRLLAAAAGAILRGAEAGPASRPVDAAQRLLLCDAQTSGGLLLAVPVGCGVAPARRAGTPRHARARESSAS